VNGSAFPARAGDEAAGPVAAEHRRSGTMVAVPAPAPSPHAA
jgi:hypothetical protein